VSEDLRPEDEVLLSRLAKELERVQPTKVDLERSSAELTHFNDPAILVVEIVNSSSPDHGIRIPFTPDSADVEWLGALEPFYRQDDEGESVEEFIGKIVEFVRLILRREVAVDITYQRGVDRSYRTIHASGDTVAEEERPVPWSWLPGRRNWRVVRRRLDLGQLVPPEA
jgi:hypothetical protein